MYAYIDADNSSATCLGVDVAGRAYGFDDAIAAVGRNGDVNSTGLYGFVAGQSNPWNLLRPIDIALDAHRMEFAVNASALNLTAGYRVVFYASDWRLEYDLALPDAAVARFPVSIQAATNAGTNWARFKDPATGVPTDTNNDAVDFYVSILPSPGQANDRHGPTIVVAKTASRAIAGPGDAITYTLYYNNTNTGNARTVWINDTLPSGVLVSSSRVAASTLTIKDSLPSGMACQSAPPPPTWNDGRTFFWNLTNVAPGSHSLTMTALVDATFSGSQLVNWAFLNYTTPGGFALNGGQSSAVVAIPELSDMIYVALVPLVIVGLKWRAQRRERVLRVAESVPCIGGRSNGPVRG